MEVDKTIVILAVILVTVLGIFALSQVGAGDVGSGVARSAGYVSQYSGGGCGR